MERAWALLSFLIIIAAIFYYLPNLASAQSTNNNIRIIPDAETIGPGTKLTVLIADGGLDASASRIDEYDAEDIELVTFRTDRSELEDASPDLKETGKNTGVFEFSIQLETDDESCDNDLFTDPSFEAIGGSNPSIGVCPGDILSISYEDFHAAKGGETVVSLSVEIKSWDPEFATDKESYDIGDRITITIIDFDANRDPNIADSLRDIKVFSDTDTVGREFSAIETGRNTGIFRLTFTTSFESQGNSIMVKNGDSLSVEYVDEFPADFALEERLNTFILTIGTSHDDRDVIRLSSPRVDTAGSPAVGKQTTLSTTITNNLNQLQPFVGIIEVRDAEGTTVFLVWQGGMLNPQSQTTVGVLWTPQTPGNYVVRTFAVSDLVNPQMLSSVQESKFTLTQ